MTQPPHGELRAHRRVPLSIIVDFHYGDVRGRCRAVNVSEGGVFLTSEEPAPVGTRIYMRLYLPHNQPTAGDSLEMIGVVARSLRSSEGSIAGMGVHFEVAFAATRHALAEFIERLLDDPDSVRHVEHTGGGEFRPTLSGPEAEVVLANAALGVQDISGFFEFDGTNVHGSSRNWLLLGISLLVLLGAASGLYMWLFR